MGRVLAMRKDKVPVRDIAKEFGATEAAVYTALARHRRSEGKLSVAERVKALRPFDFGPHGSGPGVTYTWKQVTAAATYNLDAKALSARQRDGMLVFVQSLAAGGEVVVFTGEPPAFFDRVPRTKADGDLMIRTDAPLSDEQREAFRMPTLPDAPGTAERIKAMRPFDFSGLGSAPMTTHTWKQIIAAATYNLAPETLSDTRRTTMFRFVRRLAAAGQVVAFTGQPPAFFDRVPRTAADGDLMIRTDGPLPDEQRQAFRMPDVPEET